MALAPWLPPGEPVTALAGRGCTPPTAGATTSRGRDTRAYVERAREVANEATYTDMGDRGHYLLRGAAAWNAFAARRRTPGGRGWLSRRAYPESSSGLRMKLICFIRRGRVTVVHGTKPFRFIQMNDR